EDDFDTLHPLAELLELKGYSVMTASDAERALSALRERRPDLIITDIVLPGRSGLQFIATVRSDKRWESIPILVISGCGPMILVEAEASGADLCIEKPIQIDLFWQAIEHLLGRNRDEAVVAAEIPPDEDRAIAGEIDHLVEKLRNCESKGHRDILLKELKQRILEAQGRKSKHAGPNERLL